MRNILPFLFCLFWACSGKEDLKPELPKEPEPIAIIGFNEAHTPVATGQEVAVRVLLAEKDINPEFAFDLYYAGELIDELGFEKDNGINLRTNLGPGEYRIVAKVKVGEREGKKEHLVDVLPVDFGIGAWGNSDSVIIATKELKGDHPESGLRGIFWDFQTEKPTKMITYSPRANETENYLFVNNKLVAGYYHLTADFVTNTPNGTQRNHAYGVYLSRFAELFNKTTGVEGVEIRDWRDRKSWYEEHEYGLDGIGYALMNRDLTLSTEWITEKHHAKAYVRPMANNSRYEILASIRLVD